MDQSAPVRLEHQAETNGSREAPFVSEPPPHSPEDAKTSRAASRARSAELSKAVLEFLGKCLYPAIAIWVIILIRPAISELELGSLLGRVKTIKVGDNQVDFDAQQVGAEKAEFNSKIAGLELGISQLQGELDRVKQRIAPNLVQSAADSEQKKTFQENARYSVLVFHAQGGDIPAEKITTALLGAGFRSSSTETDFSELRKTHPPGTIYVTHSESGEAIIPRLTELLKTLNVGELKVQATSTNLSRGEAQILIF